MRKAGYIHKIILVMTAAMLLATVCPQVSHAADDGDDKKAAIKKLPRTPDDLDLVDVGTVVNILGEEKFQMDNGKIYNLDQIRVPMAYSALAIGYLEQDLLGKTVGIFVDKEAEHPRKDRDGNLFVHVLREDGLWPQAVMIGKGLAWAYSTQDSRKLVIPLYKYEARARKAREGFWARPEYRVKSKAEITDFLNSYQLVQCHITHSTLAENDVYFLCDATLLKKRKVAWPASFYIKGSDWPLFVSPGSDPRNRWRGGVALVHGWVKKSTTLSTSVPTIEVTHPEQIEFIDPATGESTTRYD